MGYWGTVAKRAAKEAAKDVRLDSAVGVVVLLVSQTIVGAGLFAALGQWTGANIWTRIMTALAPFVVYPLAFTIRMVIVPASLAGEIGERASAREVREKIGSFVAEARNLQKRCEAIKGADEAFDAEVQAWFDGIGEYIIAQLGQSYVEQVANGAGLVRYASGPEPACASGLHTITVRLGELLGRLP